MTNAKPAAAPKLTSTDAAAINTALRASFAAAGEQARLARSVIGKLQAKIYEDASEQRMPVAVLEQLHSVLEAA